MKYLITLAICLSASVATAQDCTGTNLVIIPEMEAAKDAFFAGNYREFSSMMGPNFPGFMDRAEGLFAPLQDLMKGAYENCVTILQRHEAPGFYQDITVYYDDEIEGPLTLLLIGADFDGAFRFVEFSFDTSLSTVLDGLR